MNREQLVKRVAEMIWDGGGLQDVAREVVDAILPQVSTVEELEALPIGTKLLSEVGEVVHVAELIAGGRCRYHGLDGFSLMSADRAWDRWAAFGPLTVVWRPES